MIDPRERFTSRVTNYVKYRPGYPREVLGILRETCGLSPAWTVADVGSGTGLLAELFLNHGNRVLGIEPNRAMREAAEEYLRKAVQSGQFMSLDGSAEVTGLAEGSVDLVAAGQSFHWFDFMKAKEEFARILKPGGWAALIWNERLRTGTPFSEAYEALLREDATDYEKIECGRIVEEDLKAFFAPSGYQERRRPNYQEFDFEGLRGRLLSSSYAPEAGDPRHAPMMEKLREVFEQHANEGRVRFEYETRVFYGHCSAIPSAPEK